MKRVKLSDMRHQNQRAAIGPAERAAIEATNNRNAVKALRRALRSTLVKLSYLTGGRSKIHCVEEYALLAETTPKKLAGGK